MKRLLLCAITASLSVEASLSDWTENIRSRPVVHPRPAVPRSLAQAIAASAADRYVSLLVHSVIPNVSFEGSLKHWRSVLEWRNAHHLHFVHRSVTQPMNEAGHVRSTIDIRDRQSGETRVHMRLREIDSRVRDIRSTGGDVLGDVFQRRRDSVSCTQGPEQAVQNTETSSPLAALNASKHSRADMSVLFLGNWGMGDSMDAPQHGPGLCDAVRIENDSHSCEVKYAEQLIKETMSYTIGEVLILGYSVCTDAMFGNAGVAIPRDKYSLLRLPGTARSFPKKVVFRMCQQSDGEPPWVLLGPASTGLLPTFGQGFLGQFRSRMGLPPHIRVESLFLINKMRKPPVMLRVPDPCVSRLLPNPLQEIRVAHAEQGGVFKRSTLRFTLSSALAAYVSQGMRWDLLECGRAGSRPSFAVEQPKDPSQVAESLLHNPLRWTSDGCESGALNVLERARNVHVLACAFGKAGMWQEPPQNSEIWVADQHLPMRTTCLEHIVNIDRYNSSRMPGGCCGREVESVLLAALCGARTTDNSSISSMLRVLPDAREFMFQGHFDGVHVGTVAVHIRRSLFLPILSPFLDILGQSGISVLPDNSSLWRMHMPISAHWLNYFRDPAPDPKQNDPPLIAWNVEYNPVILLHRRFLKYMAQASVRLDYSADNWKQYRGKFKEIAPNANVSILPMCYHPALEIDDTPANWPELPRTGQPYTIATLFGSTRGRRRHETLNKLQELLSNKPCKYQERWLQSVSPGSSGQSEQLKRVCRQLRQAPPLRVQTVTDLQGHRLFEALSSAPITLNIHSYSSPGKAPLEMARLLQLGAFGGALIISERGYLADRPFEELISGNNEQGVVFVNETQPLRMAIEIADYLSKFAQPSMWDELYSRITFTKMALRRGFRCETMPTVQHALHEVASLLPVWYLRAAGISSVPRADVP